MLLQLLLDFLLVKNLLSLSHIFLGQNHALEVLKRWLVVVSEDLLDEGQTDICRD